MARASAHIAKPCGRLGRFRRAPCPLQSASLLARGSRAHDGSRVQDAEITRVEDLEEVAGRSASGIFTCALHLQYDRKLPLIAVQEVLETKHHPPKYFSILHVQAGTFGAMTNVTRVALLYSIRYKVTRVDKWDVSDGDDVVRPKLITKGGTTENSGLEKFLVWADVHARRWTHPAGFPSGGRTAGIDPVLYAAAVEDAERAWPREQHLLQLLPPPDAVQLEVIREIGAASTYEESLALWLRAREDGHKIPFSAVQHLRRESQAVAVGSAQPDIRPKEFENAQWKHPPGALKWMNEPKKTVLVLIGPTHLGKTTYALEGLGFRNPLLVGHNQMGKLSTFAPGKHDAIVFDDVSFADKYDRTQALRFCEVEHGGTVPAYAYGASRVGFDFPAGFPRVISINPARNGLLFKKDILEDDAVMRRITVVEVKTKLAEGVQNYVPPPNNPLLATN